MEINDFTRKFKFLIAFILIVPLSIAAGIGYIFFNHFHTPKNIQVANAKAAKLTNLFLKTATKYRRAML